MAFKNYKKLNDKLDELDKLKIKITTLKSELKSIETLKEYNEQATLINKMVEEFNEKLEELRNVTI